MQDEYESNDQRIIIAEPGMFRGKVGSFDAGAIRPAAYLLGWMEENGIESVTVSIAPYTDGRQEFRAGKIECHMSPH